MIRQVEEILCNALAELPEEFAGQCPTNEQQWVVGVERISESTLPKKRQKCIPGPQIEG